MRRKHAHISNDELLLLVLNYVITIYEHSEFASADI